MRVRLDAMTKKQSSQVPLVKRFTGSGAGSNLSAATTANTTNSSSGPNSTTANLGSSNHNDNSHSNSHHSQQTAATQSTAVATGDFSLSEGSGDGDADYEDYHDDEDKSGDEKRATSPSAAPSSSSATAGTSAAASAAADDEVLVAVDEREEYQFRGQHPALKDVCVVDTSTAQRIVPNGPPSPLSNDCFTGHVMLLMRTPDVDNEVSGPDGSILTSDQLGSVPQEVSHYFGDKKRRFEFQFQIRLKKVPRGALFLGCELEHPIKVGTITKGLVGILLAMVRRINPGFHYSWGSDDVNPADRTSGNYEKTHLSFPVEASMDRIVITPPGEAPPTLGEELVESLESVKRRRKMGVGSVDWNTEDVYTMCLWSAYADWIKWKSLNVPGVAPFSLSRVTGTQPIYLSVYEIASVPANEYRKRRPPHKRRDLAVYTRLEFSHAHATRGGLAERVLGRTNPKLLGSEMSLPDTDSVDSDFETTSRVTCA